MNITQRLRFIPLLFIVLALAAQSCAPAGSSQLQATEPPDQVEEPVTVKVVTLPFITFAPFYIALEEGYFTEQNLDVELVSMTVQEEILPALSSGQVDVSSGLVSVGILNTISRGADIKITADKGYVDPQGCVNYAIVGRKDLIEAGALERVEQLKGLKINVVPATWLEYYLGEELAKGGLTLDDVEKLNLSAPAMPDALAQKTIDIALNSEPWITRFQGAGHVPILDLPQTLLPESQAAVIMFGPTLLNENREVGERFMVAYLKAARQYNEGKTPRNLEIIAKFTQLEQDFLGQMCWPALRSDGVLNVDSVLAFQDWAMSRGYLDTAITPDQFFDGSFVDAGNTRLESGQ